MIPNHRNDTPPPERHPASKMTSLFSIFLCGSCSIPPSIHHSTNSPLSLSKVSQIIEKVSHPLPPPPPPTNTSYAHAYHEIMFIRYSLKNHVYYEHPKSHSYALEVMYITYTHEVMYITVYVACAFVVATSL